MDNNVTPEVDPQALLKSQGESNFWKLKYFELLLHTQQVIRFGQQEWRQWQRRRRELPVTTKQVVCATLTGALVGWIIGMGVLWLALEWCDDGKVFDSTWP
jgi:hypothetical protein